MMAKRHWNGLPFNKRSLFIAVIMMLADGPLLDADVLYLKNGRSITVDRFWEEGSQVFYELNGSTFGFPKSLLDRVEREEPVYSQTPAGGAREETVGGMRNETVTRTIDEARQSAQEGDLDKASRLYRQALSVAPDSILGRVELAELFISRGDLKSAQSQLEQAKRVAPDEPTVRDKLGDVYYRRGRTALAIREWQRALELSPNADLLFKLKQALRENEQDIEFDELRRPQFLIRYDGVVNEDIGRAVAAALDEEYFDLVREFHFTPQAPVTVILYTNREFAESLDAPSWASAINDGQVRIPVEGIDKLTPKLRQLLRHELTHSFVSARTAGNCPIWFQEGLAQYRAGESPTDLYEILREARDTGTIMPLWSLEGSLMHYSKDQARLAYMESLAATQYVVKRRNRRALTQILDTLADRKTMNEALKKVVGLDYQEFQTAWEADLDRVH
jgi:tetratricopeptide (TPR) repeat protein